MELGCQIEAFPRPTITWISPKKNQLTTNLNYVVDNGYQTADDRTETTVRIKRLGRQHLGKYICRAQNKLGTKEQVNKRNKIFKNICNFRFINAKHFKSGNLILKLYSSIITGHRSS